jgi:hypothetical protein
MEPVGVRIQVLPNLELGYTAAQIEAHLGSQSQNLTIPAYAVERGYYPERAERFYLST